MVDPAVMGGRSNVNYLFLSAVWGIGKWLCNTEGVP